MFYLYIVRDIFWFRGPSEDDNTDYMVCKVAGGFAIAISALLLLRALHACTTGIMPGKIGEFLHATSRFLWIVAMYIWMMDIMGEPKNHRIGPYHKASDISRIYCSQILIAAMIIQGFYVFYRWLGHRSKRYDHRTQTAEDERVEDVTYPYDEPRLHTRLTMLAWWGYWRDFENLQLLFWIGKDLAFALPDRIFWAIMYALAFLVAL